MVEPWLLDACALVDAYRSGEVHPKEVVAASIEAMSASTLNAICFVDADLALDEANSANVHLPFGGVPAGVKELDAVKGWPQTEASLVFEGHVADYTDTYVARFQQAGAILLAQTTASEFGGTNCTNTRLHGATHNPWKQDSTPGGSSGGSAAAVAGGLLPIATGGDGGGSIRIPAGFTGLVGLKGTYGRIPLSPKADVEPLTVSKGCLARSVRDTARFFDVTNGHDPRDPRSFPRVEGYEARLGTTDLNKLRVAVIPDLGTAVIANAVRMAVDDAAGALIARHNWQRVDVDLGLTQGGWEWSIAGCIPVLNQLGDLWPECADLLTAEMRFGLKAAAKHGSMDAMIAIDRYRKATVENMARAFEQVDLIICATNPDIAFGASGPMATTVDGVDLVATLGLGPAIGNNGALTIACNTSGNPAISIPVGQEMGLPIGMQVIAPHHGEQLLLDVALSVEREQPWALVSSTSPR